MAVSSGAFLVLKVSGGPAQSPNFQHPHLPLSEHFLHLKKTCPSQKDDPQSAHTSVFSVFLSFPGASGEWGPCSEPHLHTSLPQSPWAFAAPRENPCLLETHPESFPTCVFQSFPAT